jgi:hypothetical protein
LFGEENRKLFKEKEGMERERKNARDFEILIIIMIITRGNSFLHQRGC